MSGSALPKTPVGRVSFQSVFKKSAMEGGKPTYNVTLLFPPESQQTPEFLAMKKAAGAAAIAKWGADGVKKIKLRSPFRKGEEKSLDGYAPGWVFVRFSTDRRPKVVNGGKQSIEPDADGGSTEFYNGCWAHVSYTPPYAYDKAGNRGVAFGLSNVQKTRDDTPFGGAGSDPDDDFDVVEGFEGEAGGDDPDLSDVLGEASAGETIDTDIPF